MIMTYACTLIYGYLMRNYRNLPCPSFEQGHLGDANFMDPVPLKGNTT